MLKQHAIALPAILLIVILFSATTSLVAQTATTIPQQTEWVSMRFARDNAKVNQSASGISLVWDDFPQFAAGGGYGFQIVAQNLTPQWQNLKVGWLQPQGG